MSTIAKPTNKQKTETPPAPKEQQPNETNAVSPIPPEPPKVIVVEDLDVLQQVCRQTFNVEFHFNRRDWSIPGCRYLTPEEDAALEHIRGGILPPFKEDPKKPGQYIPDINNVEYNRAKEKLNIKARAQALYWCVPVFSKKHPGITKLDDIEKIVQGSFTESILESIYAAIRYDIATEVALVNFSSASPSPQS